MLPEPELLQRVPGRPDRPIPCPTVAQEMLFGAKGRVSSSPAAWHATVATCRTTRQSRCADYLDAERRRDRGRPRRDARRADPRLAPGRAARRLVAAVAQRAPRRAPASSCPALVDVHNPGLTGPVQNQPDFQAGSVDHRTHFASAVPRLARQAMAEYAELTGREYSPVMAYDCEDADYVIVGLGSVTDDVRAVLPYLRAQGLKVGRRLRQAAPAVPRGGARRRARPARRPSRSSSAPTRPR